LIHLLFLDNYIGSMIIVYLDMLFVIILHCEMKYHFHYLTQTIWNFLHLNLNIDIYIWNISLFWMLIVRI